MAEKQLLLHPLRWTSIDLGHELHSIPLNDDREHVQVGEMCPCCPRVDPNNVFVHFAFDQRDLYFRGILKYN